MRPCSAEQSERSYIRPSLLLLLLLLLSSSSSSSSSSSPSSSSSSKLPFSANVSLYLGNGTRYGRSYYRTLIGSRMFSIEPCCCRWITLHSHFNTRAALPSNYREMLNVSPTKPFKITGGYAWAKVYTVIFHRKYCSRLFEVTYAHHA